MNKQKEYQIRRSSRAKRARIIVTAEKVEVVAPLRMPEKQIQQFMRAKQDWVETAKNKMQQHVDNMTSLAPESYQQGVLIPYQGKQYTLQVKASLEKNVKIAFEQDFIAYAYGEYWGNWSTHMNPVTIYDIYHCQHPVGDFNEDCIVDFLDFEIFVSHWLDDTRGI